MTLGNTPPPSPLSPPLPLSNPEVLFMADEEKLPLVIRAHQKAAAKRSTAALTAPSPSIPTNHSLQNTPPPSPLSPPLPLSNPAVLFMADKEKLPLRIRARIHSACAYCPTKRRRLHSLRGD
ncbi:hypothetical protein J5N97_008508 [Dioscorea zingiberensis]|uniref:Uncharacterized protein n=1 Tax=Dioscorea zingiberensis TaxID=325984 RepID=A0A9D5HKY5_9LILI|nr:hypothetical protein J5N97_008508 [Dioscorea zingiberensis]